MPRLAIIKKEKCKPDLCGWACMKQCPVNMMEAECIFKTDNDKKAGIDEILCTGCGICPKICPFDAITIINLPELSNKPPIHQYGSNGFRIFNLPLVQEGSITGIMGRNGIGKSTVINVLSNIIKANFGNVTNEEDNEKYFKHLNELFKGSALQNYFNKLAKAEIKISYKPQQIVNIPKIFSGKVIELLEKVNPDKKKVREMAEKLNISQILQRDIKVLSGGELQRTAICSSLLKENANLFIFDEITNYLDIYERLNSAKLIKETLSGNNDEQNKDVDTKTALVIEHDLVVLDFLVEFNHIMYGQPGAYGMLTGIKAAKVGINNYLEGYSKEENIRFRDKPITFDKESIGEAKRVEILATWNNNLIHAGEFKLNVEPGNIKTGEIIGIIGRNALGKSTFIKHIAEQGLGDEIIISYKPQLIPKNENLVKLELMQYENYTDTFYQIYVLEPLNVKSLLEKQTDELSGGELQRYAIAKCLLHNANLYLLDEPTAFLDVEERLKISKMLKNFVTLKKKSAFIIDHDLVFMDYLSDKLLVFQGQPSIKGVAHGPYSMRDGMNRFLKELNITFRRDETNKRPRVNKLNSVKDKEQKDKGEYYYA